MSPEPLLGARPASRQPEAGEVDLINAQNAGLDNLGNAQDEVLAFEGP